MGPAGFSGRELDKHERDWERMVVAIDDWETAEKPACFQHFCDPIS